MAGGARRGYDILRNSRQNKSTAFTAEEREQLGLRGLLPHGIFPQAIQKERVLQNLRRKRVDIDKYIFLCGLQDRNERLFYKTIMDEIEEIMPLIYTPTVGQACREFSNIFRRPNGFQISIEDKGDIRRMLDNWPTDDVRIIVVTDGERILGLGDLGANGMGIPIGKLALYVACAGIRPEQCLPVMLDVGTENDEIRTDPLYLGYPHHRVRGPAYDELVHEFVYAVQDKFPKALIQFEDFLTPNAIRLLEHYRDRVLCFNDDIQGTAAVALAGVHAATRISRVDFKDQRILFFGAGSAATGIGELMVSSLEEEGLTRAQAYERIWFTDSKGLVVSSREDLADHKRPFAHDHEWVTFETALNTVRPHVLIGVAGRGGMFTQDIVEAMASINERPAIFALSNPTSKAECTAQEAYEWSDGRAIFASGSPFDPVDYKGRVFRPGQGNNSYIFPGVGLGAIACGATRVTDDMFMAAAKTLASLVDQDEIDAGSLYPPLSAIRSVSLKIATAVAETAYAEGLAREERPDDLEAMISGLMYDPTY